jgi:hypothetical protein
MHVYIYMYNYVYIKHIRLVVSTNPKNSMAIEHIHL